MDKFQKGVFVEGAQVATYTDIIAQQYKKFKEERYITFTANNIPLAIYTSTNDAVWKIFYYDGEQVGYESIYERNHNLFVTQVYYNLIDGIFKFDSFSDYTINGGTKLYSHNVTMGGRSIQFISNTQSYGKAFDGLFRDMIGGYIAESGNLQLGIIASKYNTSGNSTIVVMLLEGNTKVYNFTTDNLNNYRDTVTPL